MKTILVALALSFTATLHAGSGSYLVLASYRPAESPVSIAVPAQYLAAEIRIESDEDDWALKLSGIEEARRMLTSAAEKEGFRVRIDQALVFVTSYSKFSFSSSRGSQEALSDILVLAPLSEKTDLIQIVKKYREIISDLKPAKKVKISLGSIYLALENPEELRADLLKKIRVHVEASAKLLSDTPDYVISGLDEPVRVRQKGEREVEVFLPFRVTYGQKK
ncbi:MAG: hypothetical protein PHE83_00200 [Opitutaceae bacterium]|nr:hypothetical protein [Opitutaceae bacterium]